MYFRTHILILLACIIGVQSTFDLTNVNLNTFKYFKYPTTTTSKPTFFKSHGVVYSIRKIPRAPSKFEDSINRAQAFGKYFRNLAFGNPDDRIKSMRVLDPKFGEKWASHFQTKHGKFGEKLVDLLGSGKATREELIESDLLK